MATRGRVVSVNPNPSHASWQGPTPFDLGDLLQPSEPPPPPTPTERILSVLEEEDNGPTFEPTRVLLLHVFFAVTLKTDMCLLDSTLLSSTKF
jgi:hypothetical protein